MIRGFGALPADIMIIGDAPSMSDYRGGRPFSGPSGQEFMTMLSDAKIVTASCYFTTLSKLPAPEGLFFRNKTEAAAAGCYSIEGAFPRPELMKAIPELWEEIDRCQPNVIICVGEAVLWALTKNISLSKWRGSQLEAVHPKTGRKFKLIPTYEPAMIQRMWSWRWPAVQDLRRAERESHSPAIKEPAYRFLIRPSFSDAMDALSSLEARLSSGPVWIANDIETRLQHIACQGFATSSTEAFCIPIMCTERDDGYWTEAEEIEINLAIRRVLTHPNARIIGQNYLYDAQYQARYLGAFVVPYIDTMVLHHVCFPGTPKGLDYLSSMYCSYHRYWKDEGKEWGPHVSEDQLWTYNCKDAVVTFECAEVLNHTVDVLGLREPANFQLKMLDRLLQVMLRGVRINKQLRDKQTAEVREMQIERENFFRAVIGSKVGTANKNASEWFSSPSQTQKLFYTEMGLKPVLHKKTKRPTVDDAALEELIKRDALLIPLIEALQEYRSLGVYYSNFLSAKIDPDGRMRCSYNPCGTETFRLSSSTSAFNTGTNLQNIPRNDD